MLAHGPEGDIEPDAEPESYWFQLGRSGQGQTRYVPHLIDDQSGVGTQLTVRDVIDDGRLDVLTGSKLGTFVLLNRER